ncbi:MAG: 4Fe-4S binding protein [Clostridiales bacterium]|jgi:formate hydrogenlyase subunit 6/NADH:ubiquinone oxidoreductase subunit I|nr:4Fe-4S binding protein [Clostridiales bacterium]
MIHRFIFSLAAEGIDEALSAPDVPVVDFGRCINSRQKRRECTICREICPRGAISLDKRVKIDENLCNGCHLCHGICPTGCILRRGALIKGSDPGDGVLPIFCRRAGGGAGISLPCIASLPWEFYAYAGLKGPISVMTGDCANCEFAAQNEIQAIFTRLQLFFGEDYSEKILRNSQPKSAEYSRRELLGFFRRKPGKAAEVLLPKGSYRNLLLGELDGSQAHGWLIWEIGGNCIGCAACEKLCPGGALKISENTPQHNALKCVNCGICKAICPGKCFGEQIPYFEGGQSDESL